MRKRNILVRGVGVNDSNYNVKKMDIIDGVRKVTWECPFYKRWANLLNRCYSEKEWSRQPTYKDCKVCDEWLYFMNFKRWMEQQDWEGKELDKDLLFKGNKVYSPETCIFVHRKVNMFTNTRGASRGEYMIGVYWHKTAGKFAAQCSDPLVDSRGHLGLFNTEIEAHTAWKNQKHLYACQLADSEYVDDLRLAEALRTRYI